MWGVVNGTVCEILAICIKQWNINSSRLWKVVCCNPRANTKEKIMQNVLTKQPIDKL